MNNNIALADIRAFVTIADAGSFTAAAEILNISRAHLSRQLGQLEHQLGIQLLVRTTRSQRLTHAGEEFFEKCRSALNGIDQAVIDIKNDNEILQGPLNINCVGGPLGEWVIAPIVADFLAAYPSVTIDLDFSSHRVDLIADRFDLVIRMGALDDSRFIARKLAELPVATLASPSYCPEQLPLNHPDKLKALNCITGSVNKWSFQQMANPDQVRDIPVSGNMTCKNGHAMIHAAVNGNGIIRVPDFYCAQEQKHGALIPAIEGWSSRPIPVFALYHAKKYLPKRLAIFLEYLDQEFNNRLLPKNLSNNP